MKLFAYILSVYILVLTGFPCSEVSEENIWHKSGLSQQIPNDGHDNTDHCSPFCTCDCCTCPVVHTENVIGFAIFPFSQKYISVYSSAYISSLFVSIWQPPKLS